MTPEQEKKVIKRVIGGDKDAFEALVLANQRNVYNLALKMTRNPDDALDISQEAFIKAYNQLAGFRFDARFSVWLYRLTYNLCIDFLRKKPGTATIPLEHDDSGGGGTDSAGYRPVEIPDLRNLPEDNAMRKETRRAIAEGIDKLPGKYREILVMREITDMSYEDLSSALGINSGTVKSRLSRARLKLAEILIKSGTIPDNCRLKMQEEKEGREHA